MPDGVVRVDAGLTYLGACLGRALEAEPLDGGRLIGVLLCALAEMWADATIDEHLAQGSGISYQTRAFTAGNGGFEGRSFYSMGAALRAAIAVVERTQRGVEVVECSAGGHERCLLVGAPSGEFAYLPGQSRAVESSPLSSSSDTLSRVASVVREVLAESTVAIDMTEVAHAFSTLTSPPVPSAAEIAAEVASVLLSGPSGLLEARAGPTAAEIASDLASALASLPAFAPREIPTAADIAAQLIRLQLTAGARTAHTNEELLAKLDEVIALLSEPVALGEPSTVSPPATP